MEFGVKEDRHMVVCHSNMTAFVGSTQHVQSSSVAMEALSWYVSLKAAMGVYSTLVSLVAVLRQNEHKHWVGLSPRVALQTCGQ